MAKRYIDVAYKDRDMAKRLGARWDASVKRWYCPTGSALDTIYSWRRSSTAGQPQSCSNLMHPTRTHHKSGTEQLSLLG